MSAELGRVTKEEILASLSHALDLVEGQPRGHAARTAFIADRIAREMKLPVVDRITLWHAALIKDSGCSNNSARVHQIFGGDELLTKNAVKLADWTNLMDNARFAYAHSVPGGSVRAKLGRMLANLGPPSKIMDEVTQARCSRGAEIARRLGLGHAVAETVHCLDEHWDGKGSPRHLRGTRIPLTARILCCAQSVEVFAASLGVTKAMAMVKERSGRWFDPEVSSASVSLEGDTAFWAAHASHVDDPSLALDVDLPAGDVAEADIDSICEAFADIIDAKSTFTGEHSRRVTHYAVLMADLFGFDEDRVDTLRRAALLHDIGKLGVPNSILDKPAGLTDEEYDRVKLHPLFTQEILYPITGFERIAEVACAHHERLDGSGYWRGLDATALDLDMRILAVADVFDALCARRPYREALLMDQVHGILNREAGISLDPDCVAAITAAFPQDHGLRAA